MSHDSAHTSASARTGWTALPNTAAQDATLSLAAKGLFSILASYANGSGACHPSIATLVDLSGVSKRTVMRLLDALREHGLVEWEVRPTPKGRQRFYHVWRTGDPTPPTGGSCHQSTNPSEGGRAISVGGVVPPQHQGVVPPQHQEQEPLNKNHEQEVVGRSPSLLSKEQRPTTTPVTPNPEETAMREPTRRPTKMTRDWTPDADAVTPDQREAAARLGLNYTAILRKFRNHHLNSDSAARDWDGKFQTWLDDDIARAEKQRAEATSDTRHYPGSNDQGFPAWFQNYDPEGRDAKVERIRQQEERARLMYEREQARLSRD